MLKVLDPEQIVIQRFMNHPKIEENYIKPKPVL